ncbi:zinc finger protein AEBP2-like [Triticum urartu]|uniref:zinc finger protein AEBP2-like n=1 Tax=Triticum urartu TaxID=4572 RepID=UPI0020430948|nr:zinc finger protein AEBP2-like [Triticum urartu]
MQGATSIHRCAMFPTARCSVLPVHQKPRVAVAVPRRRARALMAVSVRPRRGGARRDRSWDDDGGGGSGDEDGIDESFFGDARDEEEDEPEEEEESPLGPGRRAAVSPESPGGQLRGSDVLRALQRAAAAKEAKKRSKRSAGAARPAARRQGKGGGAKAAEEVVAGEARPVEIRREWAPRIRELELRVRQLLHKHQ